MDIGAPLGHTGGRVMRIAWYTTKVQTRQRRISTNFECDSLHINTTNVDVTKSWLPECSAFSTTGCDLKHQLSLNATDDSLWEMRAGKVSRPHLSGSSTTEEHKISIEIRLSEYGILSVFFLSRTVKNFTKCVTTSNSFELFVSTHTAKIGIKFLN